jgi:sortase A
VQAPAGAATRRGTGSATVVQVVRGIGWTFIVSGVIVLLYVVYLLWFTGLSTVQDQQELADGFEAIIALPPPDAGSSTPAETEIEVGDAFAAMWFERDGDRLFAEDPFYVVHGTGVADLKRGPGHYVDSAAPGGDGNLAIAGHRTTYGAPFAELQELDDGDTIHVIDRAGTEWVYAYREQQIVLPTDTWVIGEDPLETGNATITLTTCHPRWSAAQRLIAFGELVGPADAAA